jgi:polysaccharide biosynthesis/export protein
MKKLIFLCIWTFIFIISLTSCRSTRDMKFLQNMSDRELYGSAVKPSDYLIKPDDNLYVDIQSINPEVSQLFSPSKSAGYNSGTANDFGQVSTQYLNGYQVNQKGMILLPVIGEVGVSGMTEEAAKDMVQKRVNEYYKDATVRLKILTYKISILGEVRTPGVYYNYNKNITILEAISLANGTTDYASIRKVLVVRPTAKGDKSFRLDMTKKETLASEAFYLLPNDIVYIEPDRYKNFQLNTTVYSMALSTIGTTVLILTYLKVF